MGFLMVQSVPYSLRGCDAQPLTTLNRTKMTARQVNTAFNESVVVENLDLNDRLLVRVVDIGLATQVYLNLIGPRFSNEQLITM